jgi:hypothetical protein
MRMSRSTAQTPPAPNFRRLRTGAATPTVVPGAGAVPNPTTVAVTSTGAVGMCYTVGGSTVPVCAGDGSLCTEGDYISGTTGNLSQITTDTTFMVRGCQDVQGSGVAHSLVATFAYTLSGADTPTSTVAVGAVTENQTVEFTSVDALSICYTVDGSTPACNADGTGACSGTGTLDSGATTDAITISVAQVVNVQGCHNTLLGHAHSAVASFAYSITGGTSRGGQSACRGVVACGGLQRSLWLCNLADASAGAPTIAACPAVFREAAPCVCDPRA